MHMKKLGFVLLLAALALLAFPHSAAFAADNTMTVTMHAQNGSGEDGTATITAKGDNDVEVVVKLSNGTTVAQPAHIHKGSCANLDPTPAYPLSNVVDGMSDTTVMVGMAELAKGGYAINVHKSAAEVSTYVSCGDIMAMAMGGSMGGQTMPATGNGDQMLMLAGLALVALLLTGAGLRLARRRA
jgi:LPXTG-motif cell wall-anchored protein